MEEKLAQIAAICKELGWAIAIPGKDEHEVHGLIIGEEEYVKYILKHLD